MVARSDESRTRGNTTPLEFDVDENGTGYRCTDVLDVVWPCGQRLLRKEVIQPQVPLRLPCYDFTPVTSHTMGGYLPCGLSRRLPVQLASMV